MPSWVSATHMVYGRSYNVVDTTNMDGTSGRRLTALATGEVLREWSAVAGAILPPYDYAESQQWLEKKFGNPTITYTTNSSSGSYITATNSISATVSNHQHPAAIRATADHNKEQDMAQRHDFTFPYTGQEIADALTAQIDAYTAQIDSLETLDISALKLLSNDVDYSKATEAKTKRLREAMDKLVRERAPYLKAAKQSFDLDLEDIEHFKLDVEAAPARPKRTRRTKAEIEAAKATSAA